MSATRLAIEGGSPVRASFLPYGRHEITEDDIAAVVQVLRSDWLTTGPNVGEFEQAFAARTGAKHAVAFSSGTAALHGATFAAGIGPGDEAITTPLTFCATANSVIYQGATPVFADVDPRTLTLDPKSVRARLTPRTRALVPVDYAGNPCAYDELLAIAEERNLIVIDDACHALGAEYDGRRIGSVAALTAFSFHPVKHIATGEGGMVTTDSPDLARKLRYFRSHGITTDARERQAKGQWTYEMVELGYNYRLSDVASVLGLSQLRRLDENIARRRAVRARYDAAFAGMPEIRRVEEQKDSMCSWHLYPVRLELERLSAGRAEIFAALRAENIGANVHYVPVPSLPYYQRRFGIPTSAYPHAHAAYERLLTLPLFHAMTDRDADDVVRAMEKVVTRYRSPGS